VFGLGAQEMLLILLALILLFGAKKIPQIAKGLGQSVGEFRKGLKDTP
jgi:sec-independent protein translocase protein TatA